MNNKEFIAALANKTGRTQDETEKLVKTALQAMGDNFESGEPFLVSGFGAFEVKKEWNVSWSILVRDSAC